MPERGRLDTSSGAGQRGGLGSTYWVVLLESFFASRSAPVIPRRSPPWPSLAGSLRHLG
ncbi:MAG: hypothetical protein ACR2JP_06250 [Acidimicrobiia bacterium]